VSERPTRAPAAHRTIGVDVGGTKIAAAVVDADGRVLARVDRLTPGRTTRPGVVEDTIVEVITALRATHEVEAVGVGAAGFVDAAGRRVMFAPHLSWREEPLADRLAARLDVPVLLDNDANAALWAEHRHGSARSARDAVLVALGTGIGGAILVDGRLHRGHGGMAGEFGHMQVVPDGRPCECGRTGCWEQYCSGKALARFAADAGQRIAGTELTAAARAGDAVARGAFAEVGRWLGVGVANVVAALDPALVIIGGGVSAAGDLLLDPARAALRSALVGADHRVVPALVPAELGPDAGMLGAADLARRALR
jgi:glucokinase